jgi:hypothetical protein
LGALENAGKFTKILTMSCWELTIPKIDLIKAVWILLDVSWESMSRLVRKKNNPIGIADILQKHF